MRGPGVEEPTGRRLRVPNTFASLKHANFRLLWFTSLLNAGANWIQQVTLGWLAYDITGSALVAGSVFGIRSLPALLIAPIGGVLGDRFDRKHSVVVNSAYMATLALGFAVLLALGVVETWHLLLFTLLQGAGQAMVQPARQALISNTVPQEDLMNAIALNSLAQNAMRVLGPALAGVLIALSGPALNFGVQSAGFVAILLLVLPLKAPYTNLSRHRVHASMAASLAGGVRYAARQPTVLGLILLALAPALFTTPINLGLLPVFANEVLNVGPRGLGFLYSAQGVGAVVGTLAIASLGNFARKGWLVSVAAVCLAVTITLYSQVTVFLVALPMLAFGTLCFMTYQTVTQTILQTITPDEYRGRVMGLHMMEHGLTPLGSLVFGLVAEFYGVSTAMFVAGICALCLVVFLLVRFPAIRNYRSGAILPAPLLAARPAVGDAAPVVARRE